MRKCAPLFGLAAVAALAACERPLTAPTHSGVCWIMVEGLNGKPDFKPIVTNIDTLENCAVRLEGVRMAQNRPVTGAFQGAFIYATDTEVTTAMGPNAQRYRVFTPQQRDKVQAGIRTLMEREGL